MNALRRIGAIGDVHCEDRYLAAALDHLHGLEVDAVVCVGDIVDGQGNVNRTCELLRMAEVRCVAGNHERWLLAGEMRSLDDGTPIESLNPDHLAWLRALPPTLRLPTAAGSLMLCHGIADDDMAVLRADTRGYALQELGALRDLMVDPTVDFMVGGHTHERMVRRFQGLTVINAGTLHRDYGAGFALVDFEDMEVHFFDLEASTVRLAATKPLPPPAPLP